MENLTEIVKKYKAEKKISQMADSSQIYFKLKHMVKEKARYVYTQKWFPFSLWHKCQACSRCKLEECPYAQFNKEKDTDDIQTCEKCTCTRGAFNLKKGNFCEYEDVENDLWLEIMRIVDNYDEDRDFNTYLIACLWDWMPKFLTKDFIDSLSNTSTVVEEDGEEKEIDIEVPESSSRLSFEEIFSVCKTEKERRIVQKMRENKGVCEIAKEMKCSHQYISLITQRLQKRLKKLLAKTKK